MTQSNARLNSASIGNGGVGESGLLMLITL